MSVPFRKVIAPGVAEAPNATWTNCLVVGDEIVISGATARGNDGNPVGGDSVKAQTLACLDRIGRQVEAAGGTRGSIYKVVIYLTDVTRKDEVNAARAEFFSATYPASTVVGTTGLVFPDLLVEVDAFARLGLDLNA